MIISISVAMTRKGVIGAAGGLPWPPEALPGELALFRAMTIGKAVIMGRKTWDSIPGLLPGRLNVVLTRDLTWNVADRSSPLVRSRPGFMFQKVAGELVITAHDLAIGDVFDHLRRDGHLEAVVIGGAEVYAQALPLADYIYLTVVDGDYPGDVYFPGDVLGNTPLEAWRSVARIKGEGYTRHTLSRPGVAIGGGRTVDSKDRKDREGIDAAPPDEAGVEATDTSNIQRVSAERNAFYSKFIAEHTHGKAAFLREAIAARRLGYRRDESHPDRLTVADFQVGCAETAVYPDAGHCILYPLLGLVDETAEMADAILRSIVAIEDGTPAEIAREFVLALLSFGEIAGVMKKAFRNADGVLDDRAICRINLQTTTAVAHLHCIAEAIQAHGKVVLPPISLDDGETAKLASEAGDAGWYWSTTLTEAGLNAGDVAVSLLAKLRNRAAAGTLRSTGDDESTRAPGPG
jgi:dihydrofolate reductase